MSDCGVISAHNEGVMLHIVQVFLEVHGLKGLMRHIIRVRKSIFTIASCVKVVPTNVWYT